MFPGSCDKVRYNVSCSQIGSRFAVDWPSIWNNYFLDVICSCDDVCVFVMCMTE